MTEISHNSPRPFLATVPPAEPKSQPQDYPQSTLSLKLKFKGIEISWTLRGNDSDVTQRLPRALATIRQLQTKGTLPAELQAEPTALQPAALPAAQPAAPQPPLEERADWCAIHGVAMPLQTNERGQWHSHRLPEGGWCKGKRKRAGD
jgi:hypothetical protein